MNKDKSVSCYIDFKIKEAFNKACEERGLEVQKATREVIEYAFKLFANKKIKTIKEQLIEE